MTHKPVVIELMFDDDGKALSKFVLRLRVTYVYPPLVCYRLSASGVFPRLVHRTTLHKLSISIQYSMSSSSTASGVKARRDT